MDRSDVFSDLAEVDEQLDDPVVAIGNFDGLHIGHRAIFDRAIRRSEEADVPSLALTFSPHPVRFFRPDVEEFRLTTDRQKFALMLEAGVDAVFALEFDRKIANLSPREFVDALLADGLGASRVVVGANFAFGKERAGSTDDLRQICRERGIATDICEKIDSGGEVVSSTRIRKLLREGDIGEATDLLARRHRLVGTVVAGASRGRELGFPTANLAPENLVPGDGIYATFLHVPEHGRLPSATSIGHRPTFEDESGRVAETYVLDHDELELYGEKVELEFVEYLREERAFDESDALVEQMRRDVRQTREILADLES